MLASRLLSSQSAGTEVNKAMSENQRKFPRLYLKE
jgi:hypothetical protein